MQNKKNVCQTDLIYVYKLCKTTVQISNKCVNFWTHICNFNMEVPERLTFQYLLV